MSLNAQAVRQKEIWGYLYMDGPLTTSELIERTGTSRDAVNRSLYRLRENGKVRSYPNVGENPKENKHALTGGVK